MKGVNKHLKVIKKHLKVIEEKFDNDEILEGSKISVNQGFRSIKKRGIVGRIIGGKKVNRQEKSKFQVFKSLFYYFCLYTYPYQYSQTS